MVHVATHRLTHLGSVHVETPSWGGSDRLSATAPINPEGKKRKWKYWYSDQKTGRISGKQTQRAPSVYAERRAPFWCVKKGGAGRVALRVPFRRSPENGAVRKQAGVRTGTQRSWAGRTRRSTRPLSTTGAFFFLGYSGGPPAPVENLWTWSGGTAGDKHDGTREEAAPDCGGRSLRLCRWVTTLAVCFNMAESEAAAAHPRAQSCDPVR